MKKAKKGKGRKKRNEMTSKDKERQEKGKILPKALKGLPLPVSPRRIEVSHFYIRSSSRGLGGSRLLTRVRSIVRRWRRHVAAHAAKQWTEADGVTRHQGAPLLPCTPARRCHSPPAPPARRCRRDPGETEKENVRTKGESNNSTDIEENIRKELKTWLADARCKILVANSGY